MKVYLPLLIFIVFLSSCGEKRYDESKIIDLTEPGLFLKYDTLTINIKGSLVQIVKYQDKYYCVFERNNPFSSLSFMDFYILNSDGDILKKLKIPEELKVYYNDLHIRNDSIIIKEYYKHNTFYLDTLASKWIKIKEVDDRIFEDENYYVTYLDFGEWGNTVWFKDKSTKKEYEFSSSTPVISKIKDEYFLSNYKEVFKIKPSKMNLCDSNSYYKIIEKEGPYEGSKHKKGGDYLFKDDTNPYESVFYIATSFVNNDTLYHLCVDSSHSFLSIIENEKMQEIESLGDDIYLQRHYNSYRGNQFNQQNQLLHFKSDVRENKGLIELNKNEIRVITIINKNTVKILNESQVDIIFKFLTEYHLQVFDSLSLAKLDIALPFLGGNNVTPEHQVKIGTDYYPNNNKFELDTPRTFEFIEDSTSTFSLDYYYTNPDKSIKIITYEWVENSRHILEPEYDKVKLQKFNNKLNEIKYYIKLKFGEPKSISDNNMKWILKNGFNLNLYWTNFDEYRRIRLHIFKE